MSSPASLYFHIPFCKRKCDYCHFYVIPDKEIWKVDYMEGLHREWLLLSKKLKDKELVSLYFGGGTPSLLGPERIGEILDWVKSSCQMAKEAEITLEANPENITVPLIQRFAAVGINRVSIGIQTLDDSLLTTLTRQHSSQRAKEAVLATAEAIENISIDLMYDLPGQELGSWERTLAEAAKLPIRHLSLYNLTFEPHTPFFKRRESLLKAVPNQETSLQMYEMAVEKLGEAGLAQYEISAFARAGYYSRHNTGYWTGRPFLGLGPSAFSYWEGKRTRNEANLSHYCKKLAEGVSPIDFSEELDPQAKARELFTIQLRLCSGVPLELLASDQESLATLRRLESEGFLHLEEGRACLTKRGRLFYDSLAADLI
jgi:oxygen-independent coproporphyrinogen-3 oxidase